MTKAEDKLFDAVVIALVVLMCIVMGVATANHVINTHDPIREAVKIAGPVTGHVKDVGNVGGSVK